MTILCGERGFCHERCRDGDSEEDDDDAEGEERADLDPMARDHLEGRKGEHGCESIVQVTEFGQEMYQQEVQRAEAHNRHDV